MKFAAFNARCPFELGDKIRDEAGREHTITDIVALHSMKEMQVRFVYELDNSGKLVNLKLNRYEETGLTPQGVFDLIERAHNLEQRVKTLEDWL